MRLQLAVMGGKVVRFISRALHLGEGSNLPGKLAKMIYPQILPTLTQNRDTILVTGTNGKTTTTHFLAEVLDAFKYSFVHNAYGANLESGIITSLLSSSSILGALHDDYNLFEVDEATLPIILKGSEPSIIVLTNIFRDQLDRYGDLDALLKRFASSFSTLPSTTTLVVNADDPLLFSLTRDLTLPIDYYGFEWEKGVSVEYQVADSTSCFLCHTPYIYRVQYYAHLGQYYCPSCSIKRPTPQVYASNIELLHQGSSFILHYREGTERIHLKLPGLYNVYNYLAAFTASLQLNLHPETIVGSLENFRPVFGRLEEFTYRDQEIKIILVKNPTGFNEVLHLMAADRRKKSILFLLNDNIADGEDISWIWDVSFSSIKEERHCYVSGLRAEEMALRLKYSEIKSQSISYTKEAFTDLLERVEGEVLYILPTYTALLRLRAIFKELVKEGKVHVS